MLHDVRFRVGQPARMSRFLPPAAMRRCKRKHAWKTRENHYGWAYVQSRDQGGKSRPRIFLTLLDVCPSIIPGPG